MLFEFGTIWKTILLFFLVWAIYLSFGYEFTVVTLLTGIFAFNCDFKSKNE
jgi:hypothetical protein